MNTAGAPRSGEAAQTAAGAVRQKDVRHLLSLLPFSPCCPSDNRELAPAGDPWRTPPTGAARACWTWPRPAPTPPTPSAPSSSARGQPHRRLRPRTTFGSTGCGPGHQGRPRRGAAPRQHESVRQRCPRSEPGFESLVRVEPKPLANRLSFHRRRNGHEADRRAAHRGARPGGAGHHRQGRGHRPGRHGRAGRALGRIGRWPPGLRRAWRPGPDLRRRPAPGTGSP